MDHLPINRGFDSHVGYLGGAEEYVYGDNYFGQPGHDCPGKPARCIKDFWYNDEPAPPAVIDEVRALVVIDSNHLLKSVMKSRID